MTDTGARPTGVRLVVHARPALFLETLTSALAAKGHVMQAVSRDVPTATTWVSRSGPDLCILDTLEGPACLDGARWLRERAPAVKLLVLDDGPSPSIRRAYDGRVVDAVVDRCCTFEQLDAALMRVVRGDRCLVEGPDELASGAHLTPRLTTRERQILERLARGATTTAIAEDLRISPHTVRMHVQGLLRKLGVHGRGRAVSVALAHHLLGGRSA
jgi:DNA-binding NarL/FixJ family response regulator